MNTKKKFLFYFEMKKRISLSGFIKENIQQVPSEILNEINDMLEKASNLDKYKKISEISPPLYENLSIKGDEYYNEMSIQSKENENLKTNNILPNRSISIWSLDN